MNGNYNRRCCRGLLALTILILSGCREEAILHELSEAQANRVLVALEKAGISAEKKHEGQNWSVITAAEQSISALAILEESRVLRNELERGHQSGSSSLVQSREERMQLVERQLAGSLESTLETLPDILQARVHLFLDTGEKLSLLPNLPKQTASVLLISDHPEGIDRSQVQKLVSGASGVVAEQVTVLVSNSKESAAPIKEKTTVPPQVRATVGTNGNASDTNRLSKMFDERHLLVSVLVASVGCFIIFANHFRSSRRNRQRLRPPTTAIDLVGKDHLNGQAEPASLSSLNGHQITTVDEVF